MSVLQPIAEIVKVEASCVQDIAVLTGKLSKAWEHLNRAARIMADKMALVVCKLNRWGGNHG
jgi:hypothetical protein